jgi:iron complex outermembrane recepter protein
LGEVVITGRIREAPSFDQIAKLDVPLHHIPITIGSVSSEIMRERAVDDITEALRSVSGVRPIESYGGFQTYTIRGFPDFVMLIDNVRDERHNIATSAPSTHLANVERIEVLKGPASVLYGHSALGGIINIVRKQPTSYSDADFSASFGSFNSRRISAGVGGPVTESLKYRFDAGISETDGWRDYGKSRHSAYLALDFEPSDRTQFQFQFGYNNDLYDTDAGILLNENGEIPDGIPLSTRYNHPDSYLKHQRYDLQMRMEYQISDNFTLSNRLSWSDDDIDYSATEGLAYGELYDEIERTFHLYFNHETKPLQNQFEAEYTAQAGRIEIRTLGGYSLSILDRKTFRGNIEYREGYLDRMSSVNPTPNQGYVDVTETAVQARDETAHGFYLQSWINPSDAFKFLIGARFDSFYGTYYTDEITPNRTITQPGERTERNSQALTWRAGAVYQPVHWFSLYGSYSTYFKPSRTFTFDNRIFNPETGYQGETGIRLFLGQTTSVTVTGFYLQKNDIVIQTGVNQEGQQIFEQIGMADSKGLEVDLQTYLNSNFSLHGGYNYTDARYREYETEDAGTSLEGNRLRFAPEHQFNIWARYTVNQGLLQGLSLAFGGYYTGANFTNDQNSFLLPTYMVLEGTIGYRFSNITLSMNVNNLLNETYLNNAIMGNQVYPGQPRTIQLILSMGL